MKSMSSNDNIKIFDYLDQDAKKNILNIKNRKKRINLWLDCYLEEFPTFSVHLRLMNDSLELPCDYWVSGLLNGPCDQLNSPVTNLFVQIFDRDMRSKELLGESVSDREGKYEIIWLACNSEINENLICDSNE